MYPLEKNVRRALQLAVDRGEIGVQVAVYHGEEELLFEWIGEADTDSARPVDGDTLFPIFSVTKAVALTALHIQAERGYLSYEEPVARYWPEFGVRGKDGITVRHVLEHRSGVPQMPSGTTVETVKDWNGIVDGIAQLPPLYPPGSKSTYAALSFGWIVGELVRRTDPQGREFSLFLQEELYGPLSISDLHLGLPLHLEERRAVLYSEGELHAQPPPLRSVAMPSAIEPGPRAWNDDRIYEACIPGAGGVATARGVARLFRLLANRGAINGVKLLSEERLRQFCQPRANPLEVDDVMGTTPWLGTGGYWIGGESPPAEPVIGTNTGILAHPGAGGSMAWADLDRKMAVAICHNRMFSLNPHPPLDRHPFVPFGEVAREIVDERTATRYG